jgi:hypothetical protein
MQILILVINLEDKLTTAISNVHKAIYDKDILKLNTELNEEKIKSHELHNTVTNLTQTNIELKEQCKLSVYVDNSKVQAIEKSHLCVKQAP